jgi:hypothetical protein
MKDDAFIPVRDALASLKKAGEETNEDIYIVDKIPHDGTAFRNGVTKDCVEIILGSNVPVLCVNRSEHKKRYLPFKALYQNNHQFWKKKSSWQFFFANSDLEEIRDKVSVKPEMNHCLPQATRSQTEIPHDWRYAASLTTQADRGFGPKYESLRAMPVGEQVQLIDEDKLRLGSLISKKIHDPEVATKALVDTAHDTVMVNHAVLQWAMKYVDNEAKKITHDLVNSTSDITKLSVHLIQQDILDGELMNTLINKSNGTIIQHITRVFLNGIDFISYFNRLITTTSIISKLRISFFTKYLNYYSFLMPNISTDTLTLEKVFRDGMRAIPPELFVQWAIGFLLHDVGKAADVEYHEGRSAYNRSIVIQHVTLGYDAIMHKTNYPREAGLITGYHHEYYGDKSGYGLFRTYLEHYIKLNPSTKPDCCMSYEVEPLLDYKAYAYFPAKVLEIVDIYDSLTDLNRSYRDALSPQEALISMREEFIKKNHMIDAVLFDIFCAFIKEKRQGGGGLPHIEQARIKP